MHACMTTVSYRTSSEVSDPLCKWFQNERRAQKALWLKICVWIWEHRGQALGLGWSRHWSWKTRTLNLWEKDERIFMYMWNNSDLCFYAVICPFLCSPISQTPTVTTTWQQSRTLPCLWDILWKTQNDCDGCTKTGLFLTGTKIWYSAGRKTIFIGTALWGWGTWIRAKLENTLHMFTITEKQEGTCNPSRYAWWVGYKFVLTPVMSRKSASNKPNNSQEQHYLQWR